jgi:Fic family protein
MYIYEHENWPDFTWKNDPLVSLLGKVRNLQGKIIGRMETLGFELKREANLETLTQDILKTSEIEGEFLSVEQVRSSIARHLGMNIPGLVPSERDIDGIVEMMLDATEKFNDPLTEERLFGWHSSLFPAGRSGFQKITTGEWRTDSHGPMQVVSGAAGFETVHFEAPESKRISMEVTLFLTWLNRSDEIDPVLKAAIAHLWFVTIHPFDDGNGRIARAITDMLLARTDGCSQRFYSISAQIRKERKEYYRILENTQKGDLDITGWLLWFLNCFFNALESSEKLCEKVLLKAKFWKEHSSTLLNLRQKLVKQIT